VHLKRSRTAYKIKEEAVLPPFQIQIIDLLVNKPAAARSHELLRNMHTTHTGDDAPFLSYDERFEHPARTWASSSHRKFTRAAVGIAMAAATFRFMQATAKQRRRR
jgi:hypothetical protein